MQYSSRFCALFLLPVSLSAALYPMVALANDHRASTILEAQPLSPSPAIVFRLDSRDPAHVFTQGFTSRGTDSNLISHLLGIGWYTQRSAFVSTSESEAFIKAFAISKLRNFRAEQTAPGHTAPSIDNAPGQVWIYTIRASGVLFGIRRSLQHALHRIAHCPVTPQLQSRINMIDHLISQVRQEQEWVAYRHIPPSLIHHASQYQLNEQGQLSIVAGSRQDNPRFVPGSTHGNALPWLIPEMTNPARTYLYRVHLQLDHLINRARSALNRLQDFRPLHAGAQWCETTGTALRRQRANLLQGELDPQTNHARQQMDATLRSIPLCESPRFVNAEASLPIEGTGSCLAPLAVSVDTLPNGHVYRDGAIWSARVPWHTENSAARADTHQASYPGNCRLDAGNTDPDVLSIRCRATPAFSRFTVYILARHAGRLLDTARQGNTGDSPLKITPHMLKVLGSALTLHDLPMQPGATGKIRSLFSAPDSQTRLYLAPDFSDLENSTAVPLERLMPGADALR